MTNTSSPMFSKGHYNVVAGSFTVRIPGYYDCGLSAYSTTRLNIITRSHRHVGAVCAAQVNTPSHTLSPSACSALVRLMFCLKTKQEYGGIKKLDHGGAKIQNVKTKKHQLILMLHKARHFFLKIRKLGVKS